MSNTSGDAWINLLYDLDLEVKRTAPSDEVMRIHEIKPTEYLVIPGKEVRFPKEVLGQEVYDKLYLVGNGTSNLEKAQVGEIRRVTLVQRISKTHIASVYQDRQEYMDNSNWLRFNPGELEQILKSAKEELFSKLGKAGVPCKDECVSFSLVGEYIRRS